MSPSYSDIISLGVIRAAWQRVRDNGGSPGIDGVTVEAFSRDLDANLDDLSTELRTERYSPRPARLAKLTKPTGGERPIVICAVRDRIVQQALLAALTPVFESVFCDCSFAYRPGRSALQALDRVEHLLREGRQWIVHADVADFFGTIAHQVLRSQLELHRVDTATVSLILKVLRSPLMDGMEIRSVTAGAPQGMAISPLLANLYLTPFDRAITTRGDAMVRYADDLLIACHSEEECRTAIAAATVELTTVKLALNEKKTNIVEARQGFEFLGYQMGLAGRGPSRKAIAAIVERLETVARRQRDRPVEDRVEELRSIIRGWKQYYHGVAGIESSDPDVRLAVDSMSADNERAVATPPVLAQIAAPTVPSIVLPIVSPIAPPIATSSTAAIVALSQEGLVASPAALPDSSAATPSADPAPEARGPVDARASYAAIPRLRQLLKNEPDFAEGYRELAEHYAAIGQFGLAKQAYDHALSLKPDLADADRERLGLAAVEQAVADAPTLADSHVTLFLQLFAGREDAYARQWVDEEGRRGFAPVAGPLTPELVRVHLSGRETFAIYLQRKNNSLSLFAIDVDVDKKVLIDAGRDTARLDTLDRLTQQDAARIVSVASKFGIDMLLENSGYKGRHCWAFFDCAVPAAVARHVARMLLEQAGDVPGGLHREIFPCQDRVKAGRFGNLLKLPLGVHRKSGRRCLFVDRDGRPIEDQAAALSGVRRVPKSLVQRLVATPGAVATVAAPPPSSRSDDVVGAEHAGPEAAPLTPPTRALANLLDGCVVVRRLVQKAVDTQYLPHQERIVLLYTIGQVADEGKAFLHRVMGRTVNYDFDVTEKYIRKLKPSPISCGRIQEVLAAQTDHAACHCRFRLGRGAYPSPVLHAFGAGSSRSGAATKADPAPGVETPTTLPRGPETPGRGDAATGGTEQSQTLSGCHSGTDQVRGDAAEAGTEPRPDDRGANAHGRHQAGRTASGTGPRPDDQGPVETDVKAAVETYLGILKQHADIEHTVERARATLVDALTRAGTDSVQTPLGILRKDGSGRQVRLVIEI